MDIVVQPFGEVYLSRIHLYHIANLALLIAGWLCIYSPYTLPDISIFVLQSQMDQLSFHKKPITTNKPKPNIKIIYFHPYPIIIQTKTQDVP